MKRTTAFFFFAFFAATLTWTQPASAENLVLEMKRSITFTPSEVTKPPVITREVVTIYPDYLSMRIDNVERIYNFLNKSLVVFDHTAKTYMVYPLHAIPIYYNRERTNRLAQKIRMNDAVREAGGEAVEKVSFEDVDLDMALGAKSNNKSYHMLQNKKEGGKTIFFDEKGDLAEFKIREGKLAKEFQKTYARYLTQETAIHPVIEEALSKAGQVFSVLSYNNRDQLRKTNAHTHIELVQSSVGPDDAPQMPTGYTRKRSNEPAVDELMARSLTLPQLDFPAIDKKISALIQTDKQMEAYLTASELSLMLNSAETAQIYDRVMKAGMLAGQSFKSNYVAAITRAPQTEADLEKFLNILDNAKEESGEKSYLIDFFKAGHIRKVLGAKPEPTDEDKQRLADARQTIIDTLKANPRLIGPYLDIGGQHFQKYEILDAFLYWDHAALLKPTHESMLSIHAMKREAEKDFPEFF